MAGNIGANRGADMTYEEAIDKATEIGREHGRNAASWFEADAWDRVLAGIRDGDPEILDMLPTADLSGQWADGYTPTQLYEDATGGNWHADASFRNDWDANQEILNGLCDAYELGFSEAVEAEITRRAEYQLS